MELLMIVLPGMFGGLIVALFIGLFGGRPRSEYSEARLEPPSPHLINMAHIRVAGGGGLGMVAMAITVAIFVPRIRFSMAVAMLLGGVLATALIAYRRRQGPLGSSTTPGAHSMFPLETPPPGAPTARAAAPRGRGHELARAV
jgi:uncharacterized SAM-binding protein YcdF (DUF218 family)